MEKKIKLSRFLSAALLMFLFLFGFIFFISKLNNQGSKSTKLLDGWTVAINQKIYNDVNLDTFQCSPTQTGDIVTLSRILPDEDETAPMLRLWVCHSAITVTADEKEIYGFDMDRYKDGLSVGTGFHWIKLTPDLYGKEIRITFYVNESNAFTRINSPVISSGDTIHSNLISETFLSLCAAIFLLIFGVCMIVLAIFAMALSPGYSQLLYTGLFSVCIGIWTFCNNGDIQLISADYTLNMAVEYFSLYLGPILVLLFLRNIRKKETKLFSIPNVLLLLSSLLLVFTVLLHLGNIVHYVSMLPIFHILYCLATIYIFVSCLQRIRKDMIHEKILLAGICIPAICLVYDIVIFNAGKYFASTWNHQMDASTWGAILFVICMVLSYGSLIYRNLCSRLEQEALINLAYSDNMTKLSNRARFMKKIEEYETSGQIYSIISFDLNDLKLTNDRLGHANGDLLLRVFARMLHDTFSSYGTVARMGGDEFGILISDDNEAFLDRLLSNYDANLGNENKKGYPFHISAAWGIASNTEGGHLTFAEVFALADKRMYLTKRDMKKSALQIRL